MSSNKMVSRVEFLSQGSRTRLVSRGQYQSPQALKTVIDMGMMEGITQTWDRLEEVLGELQEKEGVMQ